MGKRKLIQMSLLSIFSLVFLLIVLCILGNSYQMNEQKITIQTDDLNLYATLTIPKEKKVKGTIVFVHGDGPQNATQNGGYKPLMERFAKQGYASISWNKPGVGESKGNWLNHTMNDRVKETNLVIDWFKKNYPNYGNKIGLWGASQAGWVIPKVMNENYNINFSILVGPAINWMKQGEYTTDWRIKEAGGTEKDRQKGKADFLSDSQLILENTTYIEYKENGGKETLTPNRYLFVRNNLNEDATNDLAKINKKVYLILAEKDKHINSMETKKVYETEIDQKNLEVKIIPGAEHMMLNSQIAHSKLLVTTTAIIMPKYFLVDPSYLDYCEQIAELE